MHSKVHENDHDLLITVLDSATVFEGAETVYRYDLPGSGVLGGWAAEGITEQARILCAQSWPEVSIAVQADEGATTIAHTAAVMLADELQQLGATASALTSITATPSTSPQPALDLPEEDPELDLQRARTAERADVPRQSSNAKKFAVGLPQGLNVFHVAAVLVVVVVGVSAWWATAKSAGNAGGPSSAQAASVASPSAPAHTVPEESSDAQPLQESPVVVLEEDDLRVELPLGFTASVKQDVVTATGEDPDLRILLAADPAYSVPQNVLFAEIKRQIAGDKQLRKIHENDHRLVYTEVPGDGSTVTWTTWVDDNYQMSVGCHSKEETTTVQKAACRMAVDSVERQ